MIKKLFAAWAILALMMVDFGCTKKGPDEIKIGVMTPLTGDVSSWGEMQRRSTDMVLEEINNAGGVRGAKIRVIYEDDQADAKVGVNAFKKLVDADKVPIVVGSPASAVTLAVAPIANEKKVALLSSGSTATAVGKAGPYVFRIMPSDEVQSSIMASWAWDLGHKRIAVIYTENAWGQGLKDAFEKDFKAKGGEVLSIQSSTQDATDFRTQLAKIKDIKPDAIFAPLYTRGAGLMIKQARELGLKQQILGADVYGTPELIQAGGSAVDGVLYTTFGDYRGPERQEVAKKYKDKYKIDMETYATYCYDTFMIALEAIKRMSSNQPIDGRNIREALLGIENFRGVTGVTTFAGQNSATGKTFDKMTVKNGKHVPYQPSKAG
jgi:branched-chain amino acid transport system substrate-binding protein